MFAKRSLYVYLIGQIGFYLAVWAGAIWFFTSLATKNPSAAGGAIAGYAGFSLAVLFAIIREYFYHSLRMRSYLEIRKERAEGLLKKAYKKVDIKEIENQPRKFVGQLDSLLSRCLDVLNSGLSSRSVNKMLLEMNVDNKFFHIEKRIVFEMGFTKYSIIYLDIYLWTVSTVKIKVLFWTLNKKKLNKKFLYSINLMRVQ